MIFSYLNLRAFERDYLRAITDKTQLLSTILKEDIEYLLNKGLPIDKLIGVDRMMAGIVLRTPEYSSLEIIDTSGNLLYLADPKARGWLPSARVKTPDTPPRKTPTTRSFPSAGRKGCRRATSKWPSTGT